MHGPTEAQILFALEQSGYLFEQEVADRLEELGLHVDTAWAFRDPDQEKSRELDVRAIQRVYHDEKNRQSLFIELLVECKAYDSPLAFLQRPKNARELDWPIPREYLFPRDHYKKHTSNNSYQEIPPFVHLELQKRHYYYQESLKATQFSKIVRKGSDWTANHEGIYDSVVLPLTKAFEFQRKEAVSIVRRAGWQYVWLFFPMVVVRQGLVGVDVSEKPIKPEERGRISFVRQLDSENANGYYLIDFVTFAHLGSFVESELRPFAQAIVDLWISDPRLFHKQDA